MLRLGRGWSLLPCAAAVLAVALVLWARGGKGDEPPGSPTPLAAALAAVAAATSSTGIPAPTPLATGGRYAAAARAALPTATSGATPTSTVAPTPAAVATASPSPTAPATPRPLALGVSLPGAPADMSALATYARGAGRAPAIVMWYLAWPHGGYPSAQVDAVLRTGATPMLTWEPWDSSNTSPNQPTYKLTNITRGDFDGYIRQFARSAAASRQHVYLRFAHEMNSSWYPWGTQAGNVLGNAPQDYVDAWRHVHDIFAREGATNVVWVWSPVVSYIGSTPVAEVYPGDAYVDWLALDGYNWGTTQPWSAWASLAEVLQPSYASVAALSQKPMLLAETASAEQGGDKAQWIRQAFLADLPRQFPRIRAVVWFDFQKETAWPVDSSPATLTAWRQVVASPLYQGSMP